jgi:hypothetical protein
VPNNNCKPPESLRTGGPLRDNLRNTRHFKEGKIDMGDKGKRDKGKKEQQKKAKLTPKEKRKLKKEKKNK